MKLVALDLDGTLLNGKKKISNKNLKRIQALRESGVKVVLASGRPSSSMRIYYSQLGLDEPILCDNGALLLDLKTEEAIASKALGKAKLMRVAEILRQEAAYFTADTALTLWVPSYKFDMKKWMQRNSRLKAEERVDIRLCRDFQALFESEPIYKLWVFCPDEGSKIRRMGKVKAIGGLQVVDSMPQAFDVMEEGVSKAGGLRAVADYYGIGLRDIVFMGDHNNDVEALKAAGIGVAMANATEAAKAAANRMTGDCEDDGVAQALDEIFGRME
jgi:hypothetical protein